MLGINKKLLIAYYPQIDRQTERINQELKQYLRMFIDHRQEQWPDWLVIAKFTLSYLPSNYALNEARAYFSLSRLLSN